ncbi:response regulator [Rheinheimera tilapiae]|uniref:Response regulator n=1 Tax=Rheinheimera tilapiae TaxID=875043 RepID=A0ABV6B7V1_9GAMM
MSLKKILHVEDDESIRLIVEMALVDLFGMTLVSCDGGAQALAQLNHFVPELILMDAMMPKMDGLQVLAEIRQRPDTLNIPVVFMTARIQQAEKQQYLDAGAIAVIEKPFEATELGSQLSVIYQQYQS